MRTVVIFIFILTSFSKLIGQNCDVNLIFLGYDCESMSWLYRFDIDGPGVDYRVNATVELPLVTFGSKYDDVNDGDTLFVTFGDVSRISFIDDGKYKLVFSKEYANTDVKLFIPGMSNADCMSVFTDKQYIFNIDPSSEPIEIDEIESCEIGPGIGEFELFLASLEILGPQEGTVVFAEDSFFTQVIDFDFYISQPKTIYAAIDDGDCLSPFIEIPLVLLPSDEDVDFKLICDGEECTGICDTAGIGKIVSIEFEFEDPDGIYNVSMFTIVGAKVEGYDLVSQNGIIKQDLFVDAQAFVRVSEISKEGGSCLELSLFYNEVSIGFNKLPIYDVPELIESCVSYALDGIVGDNVGNDAAYFTQSQGQGTKYDFGDVIDTDLTLFVFDTLNACIVEDTFEIKLERLPDAGPDTMITVCENYLTPIDLTESISPTFVPIEEGWIFKDGSSISKPDSFDVSLLMVGSMEVDYLAVGSRCPTDTAQVTLEVIKLPEAGQGSVQLFCQPEVTLDLIDYISDYDQNGTWYLSENGNTTEVDRTQALSEMGVFDYLHVVEEDGYCASDTAEVSLRFIPPTVGDFMIDICETEEVPDLSYLATENSALFYDENRGEFVDWSMEIPDYPAGAHSIQYWQPFPSECGVDTSTIVLNIAESIKLPFDLDISECVPDDNDLIIDLSGASTEGFSYILNNDTFAIDDGLIIPSSSDDVRIIANCFIDTVFEIPWVQEPNVSIEGLDVSFGKQLSLESDAPISNIEWLGDNLTCVFCDDVVLTASGNVMANYMYQDICMGTVTGQFDVADNSSIFYPSIFSTNANLETNRTFYLTVEDPLFIEKAELYIYDRYGNAVFSNRDYVLNSAENGWDGQTNGNSVEAGVYIFVLKYTKLGIQQFERGSITLVH